MLYVILGALVANLGFTLLLFRVIERHSYVVLTEALKSALDIERRLAARVDRIEAAELTRSNALLGMLSSTSAKLDGITLGLSDCSPATLNSLSRAIRAATRR